MSDREKMPQRRSHEILEFIHAGMTYTVGVGRYGPLEAGEIGEVFLDVSAKSGAALESIAHDAAILLSFALQYGASIADMQRSIAREVDGKPQSLMGAMLDAIDPEVAEKIMRSAASAEVFG